MSCVRERAICMLPLQNVFSLGLVENNYWYSVWMDGGSGRGSQRSAFATTK